MSISRVIHQVWIGPRLIPDREQAWCEQTRKMNDGWGYKLHGNELLTRYASDPFIRAMQAKGERIAFITDRLRVLLLRDEGGVYVDCDAEPQKPLDALNIWGLVQVDFVAGLRSPQRRDVALYRGVPIIDNTFMASAKGGRMIGHIEALWTPAAVTGENCAINGHRTGICIMEHAGPDTILLNHRYIYCETKYPESLIMHDDRNLASWCSKPTLTHGALQKPE